MADLLLVALIACSTGEAKCNAFDTGDQTIISVCDITPGQDGQRKFRAVVDGDLYVLTLQGECSDA